MPPPENVERVMVTIQFKEMGDADQTRFRTALKGMLHAYPASNVQFRSQSSFPGDAPPPAE